MGGLASVDGRSKCAKKFLAWSLLCVPLVRGGTSWLNAMQASFTGRPTADEVCRSWQS